MIKGWHTQNDMSKNTPKEASSNPIRSTTAPPKIGPTRALKLNIHSTFDQR